jgi:hypothetical protein
MAERLQQTPLDGQSRIDLAYQIVENTHPDFGGLELHVCDFELSEAEARGRAAGKS